MSRKSAASSTASKSASRAANRAASRADKAARKAAEHAGKSARADARAAAAEQDFLHLAADRVGPLLHTAADRVGPLAHTAADRIAPLTSSARGKLTPLAAGAAGLVAPYAAQAAGRVGPYAQSARDLGTKAAQDAVVRLQPTWDDAVQRVTPAVGAAKDRVSEELLPRLTGAWEAAASAPVVAEAARRGKATLAAAKGELVLTDEKPARRWPQRLAVGAGVAGVVYVALRKFLASKDADWQAARPTAAYTPARPPAPSGAGSSGPTAARGAGEVSSPPTDRPGTEAEAAAAEAAAADDEGSALSKFDAAVEAPTETKRYSASDPITVLADEREVDDGSDLAQGDRH